MIDINSLPSISYFDAWRHNQDQGWFLMPRLFQHNKQNIIGNPLIRTPQLEAYEAMHTFNNENQESEREVGLILPVGCGKSGCIALAPFAFSAARALVVAPSLKIADQLLRDFDPSNSSMFYRKCSILTQAPYPEPVEIRGTTTNRTDLDEADVVITNIQQLQGGDTNSSLQGLPSDFFDLILFDEGHHNVASSWTLLKAKFPDATIVNFSATPLRADGQMMAGRIIYSYPIFRAIQEGFVKRLKAVQLNPRTLRYVRNQDGVELEVGLDEVRRLGEEDADFRRSIVTSRETLATIVDASIRELDRLRQETGEKRLKIIASALNYDHCRQIVEAYQARGQRAGYVHSREDSGANKRVFEKLDNHELDVIVQVRKLSEGFDHPFLSVAAVFSIFSNLSPFIQFVGRIMRVITQNAPGSLINQGVVVFHAGANIARQWSDFQSYSGADQEYFDQLLPLDGIEPGDPIAERTFEPLRRDGAGAVDVLSQTDVRVEEIPLLQDAQALEAIRLLHQRGYSVDDIGSALRTLEPVPVTKVRERQAKRNSLDVRVKNDAMKLLAKHQKNPEGKDLDKNRLGRTNLIVMKASIDRRINALVNRGAGERHEFSKTDLEAIESGFNSILTEAENEVFNGTN